MYLAGGYLGAWSKSQFDAMRQTMWDQGRALLTQADTLIAAGQSPAPVHSQLRTLLAEFQAKSNEARESLGGSYVDSRFHDYYDALLTAMNNQAARAPAPAAIAPAAPAPDSWFGVLPSSNDAGGFGAGSLTIGGSPSALPAAPVGSSGGYIDAGDYPSNVARPAESPALPAWAPWAAAGLLAFLALR